MNKSTSQLSLSTAYCHNISTENYFLSPKMPIKDHSNAFRSTKTHFRPAETYQKSRGVLGSVDVNDCGKVEMLTRNINSLSQMSLLKEKNLHVITHDGADKSLNSCTHTRQTNPGYSRNTLGGIYTK